MNRLRAVCASLLCMAGFVSDRAYSKDMPDDLIIIRTSDQQEVPIRRVVAEAYFSTLKHVLELPFEKRESAISVDISHSILTILINLLEGIETGRANKSITLNGHDEPIAQQIQVVVDQIAAQLDQSTLEALSSAADFLGLPRYLINSFVRRYVSKINVGSRKVREDAMNSLPQNLHS